MNKNVFLGLIGILLIGGCASPVMDFTRESGEYADVYQTSEIIIKQRYEEEYLKGMASSMIGAFTASDYTLKRRPYYLVFPISGDIKNKMLRINATYNCSRAAGGQLIDVVTITKYDGTEFEGRLIPVECDKRPVKISITK
ncbi:MAG: hypothetical protein WA981_01265 [Glaciecola sp.]